MLGGSLSTRYPVAVMTILRRFAFIFLLFASGPLGTAQQPAPFPAPGKIAEFTGGAKPFFEIRDEDNVYGVLDVAMDGTVLMFSLQGDPHPDRRRGSKIYLKRSMDGGATWSDHELLGKPIELDEGLTTRELQVLEQGAPSEPVEVLQGRTGFEVDLDEGGDGGETIEVRQGLAGAEVEFPELRAVRETVDVLESFAPAELELFERCTAPQHIDVREGLTGGEVEDLQGGGVETRGRPKTSRKKLFGGLSECSRMAALPEFDEIPGETGK